MKNLNNDFQINELDKNLNVLGASEWSISHRQEFIINAD